MREGYGNLFDLVQPHEAVVITTNGTVAKDGRGVMGKGVALEARRRWPGIDRVLGDQITRYGNHAWVLGRVGPRGGPTRPDYSLIFMPVKHHWRDPADLELITRSAHEMVRLADHDEWQNIWLPHPGCGAGQLNWADVRPAIEDILDDRFIAVTRG